MSEDKPKRGRKKGTPKTGGRKKGTPNKNSFCVRKALDELGFNLMEEMIQQYYEMSSSDKRMNFLQWLSARVYPRLAEVPEVPTKDPMGTSQPAPKTNGPSTAQLVSIVKRDAQ